MTGQPDEQLVEQPGNENGEVLDAPNQQSVGLDPPWVEGSGGTPEADQPGLDEMTKAELLDHARSIGATPANNDMTKDELRASIDEKLTEGG